MVMILWVMSHKWVFEYLIPVVSRSKLSCLNKVSTELIKEKVVRVWWVSLWKSVDAIFETLSKTRRNISIKFSFVKTTIHERSHHEVVILVKCLLILLSSMTSTKSFSKSSDTAACWMRAIGSVSWHTIEDSLLSRKFTYVSLWDNPAGRSKDTISVWCFTLPENIKDLVTPTGIIFTIVNWHRITCNHIESYGGHSHVPWIKDTASSWSGWWSKRQFSLGRTLTVWISIAPLISDTCRACCLVLLVDSILIGIVKSSCAWVCTTWVTGTTIVRSTGVRATSIASTSVAGTSIACTTIAWLQRHNRGAIAHIRCIVASSSCGKA